MILEQMVIHVVLVMTTNKVEGKTSCESKTRGGKDLPVR